LGLMFRGLVILWSVLYRKDIGLRVAEIAEL
jgi:hypothetical protein